jgi:hypothetical protein
MVHTIKIVDGCASKNILSKRAFQPGYATERFKIIAPGKSFQRRLIRRSVPFF